MEQSSGPRLFIVDDELKIRSNMKEVLQTLGIGLGEIIACANAAEAIMEAERAAPDIMITDVVMHGMSGHDLIERIGEINPKCINMMISGHSDVAYLQRAIRLRVVGYILKPVDYDELLLILHNAMDEYMAGRSGYSVVGKSSVAMQESSNAKHRAILALSLAYIERNFHKNIGAADIARHCGISPGYLSTIFKQLADTTIPGQIASVRLQRATEMLMDVRIPISRIAAECGFNNANYFTRVFRQRYGMVPSTYREKGLRNEN